MEFVDLITVFVVVAVIAILYFLLIRPLIDYIKQKKEEKNRENQFQLLIKNSSEEYSEYLAKYNSAVNKLKSSEYYLYLPPSHISIVDNNLYVVGPSYTKESFSNKIIKGEYFGSMYEKVICFDDIKYYQVEGSVYHQQLISGGGGGGSSLGGAAAGYLLAGGVGAVIGSRQKVEGIKTTYVNVDDRKLIITLFNNSTQTLDQKYYECMLKYAPQKDYDVYIANLKSKGVNE